MFWVKERKSARSGLGCKPRPPGRPHCHSDRRAHPRPRCPRQSSGWANSNPRRIGKTKSMNLHCGYPVPQRRLGLWFASQSGRTASDPSTPSTPGVGAQKWLHSPRLMSIPKGRGCRWSKVSCCECNGCAIVSNSLNLKVYAP